MTSNTGVTRRRCDMPCGRPVMPCSVQVPEIVPVVGDDRPPAFRRVEQDGAVIGSVEPFVACYADGVALGSEIADVGATDVVIEQQIGHRGQDADRAARSLGDTFRSRRLSITARLRP